LWDSLVIGCINKELHENSVENIQELVERALELSSGNKPVTNIITGLFNHLLLR
jgi:hypothetical protein